MGRSTETNMASIETKELPLAARAADPWPRHELGDDGALGLQADEMFARQLDTRFAGEVGGPREDRSGDGSRGPGPRGRAGRDCRDRPASGNAERPLSG